MSVLSVSIIIVNYNTEAVLKNCLISIKEKTQNIDYEIIVIDNNSKKGSLELLIYEFPDVRFELTEQNPGFGAANNRGASLANGRYLFFLNPDTLLLNNTVWILGQFMDMHRGVGVCGANMYKADMSPASSFYMTDFLLYEYKIIFNMNRSVGFNTSKRPKNVRVIVGADLMISKEVFNKVGGFDTDFFMYFDEVELCDRVRRMGYQIMSVPSAEIIHLQGESAENKSEELSRWSYKEHWYSKFLYFSKTKGDLHARIIYSLYMLKMKLATQYYKLRGKTNKIVYWDQKKLVIKFSYKRYLEYLLLHK